jgi:monoamine oxidase
VHDLITLHCKVTAIHQDDHHVTVTYNDMAHGGAVRQAEADYCVCTIPLTILSQLDVQVSGPMKAAIAAVPYASSVKLGLEFKRRFWEQDDQIYGGISFTNQPISQISYPSHGYFSDGPAVLLGGYMFGPAAYDFAGMTPAERIEHGLAQGTAIHANYRQEFRAACRWRGAACRGPSAAVPCGRNRRARPITRRCARSTTGSCWPVSMRRMSAAGRRGHPVVAGCHYPSAQTRAGSCLMRSVFLLLAA